MNGMKRFEILFFISPYRMSSEPATLITVWIIEDDTHYRESLHSVLDQTAGLQCTWAFMDCESALAHAKVAKTNDIPNVILLDINLPGLSGIEGIGQLKAYLPQASIVMLTILDTADTIYDALRAGASGYLLKNASLCQIIDAIRAANQGGTLMPAQVASKVLGFFTMAGAKIDYGLTEREKEVLREMGAGYSQKEIAARLFVSPYTVNTHIQHIYEKLHVHSGIEAVAKAIRERLI